MVGAEVETNSHPVLEPAHELRIRRHRWGSQMPGSNFAVHGQYPANAQLEPSAVAPGPNCVRKTDRTCGALEAEPAEGVWHEALPQPGVDGAEQEVGIGRP